MAEKRFRVLFMIFSESYFATAPFSRKRSEPSTASTLPASGCGECLVPHFDHLELRGPAFGFKAVALGSHGALLALAISGSVTSAKAGAHTLSTMHSATRAESSLWVRVVCFIWNSSFLLTGEGYASALKIPYFTFFFNKTCVKRPKTCVKNVLNRCARLCPLLQFVRKGCKIQSQSNTGELVKQAERKYPNFDPFT